MCRTVATADPDRRTQILNLQAGLSARPVFPVRLWQRLHQTWLYWLFRSGDRRHHPPGPHALRHQAGHRRADIRYDSFCFRRVDSLLDWITKFTLQKSRRLGGRSWNRREYWVTVTAAARRETGMFEVLSSGFCGWAGRCGLHFGLLVFGLEAIMI